MHFLERAGEWLNPILVKEARQALKSRQFVVTFGLVLLYSWGVSIVGLAMIGPEATYGANGPVMFGWYYAGLAFCLLIVVPFGAFRSLAVEQEERTYELLSITALKPRQIVSGKLGSAVVQMLVYLSASLHAWRSPTCSAGLTYSRFFTSSPGRCLRRWASPKPAWSWERSRRTRCSKWSWRWS